MTDDEWLDEYTNSYVGRTPKGEVYQISDDVSRAFVSFLQMCANDVLNPEMKTATISVDPFCVSHEKWSVELQKAFEARAIMLLSGRGLFTWTGAR